MFYDFMWKKRFAQGNGGGGGGEGGLAPWEKCENVI